MSAVAADRDKEAPHRSENRPEEPVRPHNPFDDPPDVPLDSPADDPVEGPDVEEDEDSPRYSPGPSEHDIGHWHHASYRNGADQPVTNELAGEAQGAGRTIQREAVVEAKVTVHLHQAARL